MKYSYGYLKRFRQSNVCEKQCLCSVEIQRSPELTRVRTSEGVYWYKPRVWKITEKAYNMNLGGGAYLDLYFCFLLVS